MISLNEYSHFAQCALTGNIRGYSIKLKNSKTQNDMATNNLTLEMQREELIHELQRVDNIEVIEKVKRSLKRALAAVKRKEQEEESDHVTKEQFANDLYNAFVEMYRAERDGVKLKAAEELLNEL